MMRLLSVVASLLALSYPKTVEPESCAQRMGNLMKPVWNDCRQVRGKEDEGIATAHYERRQETPNSVSQLKLKGSTHSSRFDPLAIILQPSVRDIDNGRR